MSDHTLTTVAGHAPAPPRPLQTIRREPRRGLGRALSPRELWRFRDVAIQIAVRDVTVRYRQTALGAAWAILQPLGTMVVFSIFFGKVAGISSEGVSYWLFSLAALVPWTYFATVLTLGADSLVANTALVGKIYFPRIFIPLGVVAAGLVDLAAGFAILLVVLGASGVVPSPPLLVVPLLVLITLAAAVGVAGALAALNVRYRDVRYVVPFLAQLWLFATPIAYPSTLLHEPWRTLSALNPMTGVVEGFRWSTLHVDNHPWTLVAVSAASAAVLLAGGLAYFSRAERAFADEL